VEKIEASELAVLQKKGADPAGYMVKSGMDSRGEVRKGQRLEKSLGVRVSGAGPGSILESDGPLTFMVRGRLRKGKLERGAHRGHSVRMETASHKWGVAVLGGEKGGPGVKNGLHSSRR